MNVHVNGTAPWETADAPSSFSFDRVEYVESGLELSRAEIRPMKFKRYSALIRDVAGHMDGVDSTAKQAPVGWCGGSGETSANSEYKPR